MYLGLYSPVPNFESRQKMIVYLCIYCLEAKHHSFLGFYSNVLHIVLQMVENPPSKLPT